MNIKELRSKLTRDPHKVWFAVSYEKKPDKFSYLISKFQGTNYTHALAIYYSMDLHDFVVASAHGRASQLDTLDQFNQIDEVQYLFEKDLLPEERLNFIRKVVGLDGIDYSEMQIVDIGIESIFGIRMKSNGIEGVICSEYADLLAQAAGIPSTVKVVKNRSIETISPKDNVKAWRHFCSKMITFREITLEEK